jgi:hypothetical protein
VAKFLSDNFDKLLPIVTLIIGSLLTSLSAYFSDRRQRTKEKEVRLEQRLDGIRIKRNDGQREVLLALQDALATYMRFVGMAHHHDEMHARKGGVGNTARLPDEADQGLFNSQLAVSKIHHRVRDEDIRGMINQLKDECVKIALPSSRRTADQAMDQAVNI